MRCDSQRHPRFADTARAVTGLLWASAAALVLLIVVQSSAWVWAQPFGAGKAGASSMVSSSGQVVCLTAEIGKEDLIVFLNNRAESLAVYRLDPGNQPQLYQQFSLPRLFVEARARGPGRR
ncbi:MAG: hypothetical protein KF787_02980 [Phycisphaeraceae bacterium]|nr:hypothetical protein [Phycisphaerae bacterium]MBX3391591.1 hypothetical protein [Phycisphaeraceae bacterium]HRJ49701.1 hypothetical protein [Phycisphaerales bacterium]